MTDGIYFNHEENEFSRRGSGFAVRDTNVSKACHFRPASLPAVPGSAPAFGRHRVHPRSVTERLILQPIGIEFAGPLATGNQER